MKALSVFLAIVIGILMMLPCFIVTTAIIENKLLSIWIMIVIFLLEILGLFIAPIKFYNWFSSKLK